MDITFKKKRQDLQDDFLAKSMDVEHGVEDLDAELENCSMNQKFITISPECVRCNLCVEECPVEAIADATSTHMAKILESCVKCEICAKTCPVGSVHVMESTTTLDEDVSHRLHEVKVPHRTIRMKNIDVNPEKCQSCGTCAKFCPTGAITVEDGKIVEINKDMCIGCGACVNLCPEGAVKLERKLGDIEKTWKLTACDEICVACGVCEENCPVDAVRLEDGKVTIAEDKCILCDVCSTKCPVGALKLERLTNES